MSSNQEPNSSFSNIYKAYKEFVEKELKSRENQYILPLVLGICNDLEQIKKLDGRDFNLLRKACILKLEYEEWKFVINKFPL
ncbi:hypothetical protein F0310_05100 (plasmid) [Borrelia sp. A-FGy1]|uniref:hypothetical protein n=1 Tax=Borrelia sp. A-FGy1 TaxID=2608247 RepID=UPI0015F5A817|nr:hypothetical protein [Borrelia sp. A-FGy1]QMU99795.1 hypothetical protein F0310_05100 [Borrelia sp. A-FGy1]